MFVTTRMMDVAVVTDRRHGAIGVDLNADHLAVAQNDASGNYVNAWRVSLVTCGKSYRQAEAIIGDAVAGVVKYAHEVGKPIVIERLNQYQGGMCILGYRRRPKGLRGSSGPQLGCHRQCGLAICTFHLGFSLGF